MTNFLFLLIVSSLFARHEYTREYQDIDGESIRDVNRTSLLMDDYVGPSVTLEDLVGPPRDDPKPWRPPRRKAKERLMPVSTQNTRTQDEAITYNQVAPSMVVGLKAAEEPVALPPSLRGLYPADTRRLAIINAAKRAVASALGLQAVLRESRQCSTVSSVRGAMKDKDDDVSDASTTDFESDVPSFTALEVGKQASYEAPFDAGLIRDRGLSGSTNGVVVRLPQLAGTPPRPRSGLLIEERERGQLRAAEQMRGGPVHASLNFGTPRPIMSR